MNSTFTEIDKRKILSILGPDIELIKLASCKIYTTTKENDSWLYSDIEGFLCFVLDFKFKARFLIVFDMDTYKPTFRMELYHNFQQTYYEMSDDFHCFEVGNGFVGFKFFDINEAKMFSLVITKFDDDFVGMLLTNQTKKLTPLKTDMKKRYNEYCTILKNKFSSNNHFDENYIEEGLEIIKPRYFELLNNITFDREKKEFKVGHIPSEFKNLFKNIGIKKSDLKNPKLALNIVKSFIETIDNFDNVKREKTIYQARLSKVVKNYKNTLKPVNSINKPSKNIEQEGQVGKIYLIIRNK